MWRLSFIFTCLFLSIPCFADTFTHRRTGEAFHGYATQRKQGDKTIVRIGNKTKPRYLNIADYDIEWNYTGRRNRVIVLPVKNEIELECETEAFEKAIETASNQGPLLILIEIDTPGGRGSMMKRICTAITKTNNCRTVAFVCGGKYGGAYSAGAIIALACDYIYMADNTAIGAATGVLRTSSGIKDLKSVLGETVGEKFASAARAYIAAIAEQNNRSGLLAKAMVDKDIEVLEVTEEGKSVFIEPQNKKTDQSVLHVWSKKGSLLTLTAAEAVECGMADKLIGSLKELTSELSLTKARIVKNNSILKARRKFEASEQKLEKIYAKIDLHKKRLGSLREQANSLVDEYNRLNHSYACNRGRLMREIAADRKQLLYSSSGILKKLISEYKAVIDLKELHTDLQVDIVAFKKAINSAKVERKEIEDVH